MIYPMHSDIKSITAFSLVKEISINVFFVTRKRWNRIENNCICKICKKNFHSKPSRIRKGEGIYCSRKCKNIGISKNIENIQEIIELYNKGYGYNTIARKFKIHQRKIKNVLLKNNIIIRTPSEQKQIEYKNEITAVRRAIIKNCKVCGNPFKFHRKSKELFCSIKCRDKDIDNKDKIRKATQKQLKEGRMPKAYTSIEKKVKEFLDTNRIKYEYQKSLDRWTFDFSIGNILIECNGNYWHGNPKFYNKLNKMQEITIERDKQKSNYATSHGFNLLILWENDINNNFEIIKNTILNLIITR